MVKYNVQYLVSNSFPMFNYSHSKMRQDTYIIFVRVLALFHCLQTKVTYVSVHHGDFFPITSSKVAVCKIDSINVIKVLLTKCLFVFRYFYCIACVFSWVMYSLMVSQWLCVKLAITGYKNHTKSDEILHIWLILLQTFANFRAQIISGTKTIETTQFQLRKTGVNAI